MKVKTKTLARSITWKGSKQTYLIAILLVDKSLKDDFCRAYAYFRWADDIIDIYSKTDEERKLFINKQKELINDLYKGKKTENLLDEEQILADLITNDKSEDSGLQSFIRNMFAIIEFDTLRKGKIVTKTELENYYNCLAKSVIDGLLYFVGNKHKYAKTDNRYDAALVAHKTHLLRDMHEDVNDGFINIPEEYLKSKEIDYHDFNNTDFKNWVVEEVNECKQLFISGKKYINNLPVLRCKIVGHWYCLRFESVLSTIVKDKYVLRSKYNERKKISTWFKILGVTIKVIFKHFL